MPALDKLLELSKSIATRAGVRLLDALTQEHKEYSHCPDNPKEIKARADAVLEDEILKELRQTGLPVLSEESGYIPGSVASELWFIVDPLDGTFNFVKGLGPCAVSIALWERQTPIFGVIYSLADRNLAWGGAAMGSYFNDRKISVSGTRERAQASICTGFPVRFDFASGDEMRDFWRTATPFAKVRMLGSAAISMLHVARGSADVYMEKGIMLWDVAAGIAIVEGAGGTVRRNIRKNEYSLDVYASNGILSEQD